MAASVNHIVFFFFLIVLSSSVQIQAREGKFFSKIIHLGAKITAQVEPTPSQAPAPAPEPAFIDNQEPYYGLYGHGNTPTTTSTFGNSLFAEEFADEKYETGFEKNNNNNYYYDDGGNNERERQGMSDTRFVEGGKYYYDVKNGNYYPNGYEYSSSKEASTNEGYYGNTDNSNEFNSMEDEYRERQGGYVP
ncbi:hypothetical protein V6N13_017620 [Hibiscus sabdariffa]|uniref:Uncharacterized protein n=2 Tax=Hibiscus sabdariffa TaxID=183260 RepID=A0ABR1ZV40_9ROSI